MGHAGKVGEHHPEAVVERDRDAEPVFLGEAHALADDEPVVENVVVGQDDTFREPRGAARVLNVDGVVKRERLAPLDQLVHGDLVRLFQELVPGEHAVVGDIPEEYRVFKERELLARDPAGLCLVRLGTGLVEHPHVVRGLEPALDDERLDLGLLEHVLEFVGAVGRVEVDHDGAYLGGRKLDDYPFGIVHCPDTDPVAFLHAKAHQAAGDLVYLFKKFAVRQPDILVHGYDRFSIRVFCRDAVNHLANCHSQQGHC